jgi:hypothetical protein
MALEQYEILILEKSFFSNTFPLGRGRSYGTLRLSKVCLFRRWPSRYRRAPTGSCRDHRCNAFTNAVEIARHLRDTVCMNRR